MPDSSNGSDAWRLFDRDTSTGWVPGATDTALTITFDGSRKLTHLKVYGQPGYELRVTDAGGHALPGVTDISLSTLQRGWNILPIREPRSLDRVVLHWKRTALTKQPTPIAEIELWAAQFGPPDPVDDAQVEDLFASSGASTPTLPSGLDMVWAGPDSKTLRSDGQTDVACATFSFVLPRPPASYRRVWIGYEADRAFRPFAFARAINGAALKPGHWLAGQNPGVFVEPVDPERLAGRANTLAMCIPPGVAASDQIRRVRVIGELDDGSNFVDSAGIGPAGGSPTEAAPDLLDPRALVVHQLAPTEQLTLAFERWASPDFVALATDHKSWNAACFASGNTGAPVPVDTISSRAGITVLGLHAPADGCTALALSPSGSSATVSFAGLVGSGTRQRIDWPRITLASKAEHFGTAAWIEGWISAPAAAGGAPHVQIGGTTLGRSTDRTDGVFAQLIARDDATASDWPITVTATLGSGSVVTGNYVLTRNSDIDASMLLVAARDIGADGLSPAERRERYGDVGQITEEDAEPDVDVSVRLGSEVGVELPAGAVKANTKITAGHLERRELPTLDEGMFNVTAPAGHGYEFLPHGQRFSKAVKVILPYDRALIPSGYTEDAVNTYFFDEESKHWRSLSRAHLDKDKRSVHSLTEHFTVMINAVVVTPEHPEIASFNPNEMRDLQAADPSSRINLIEPPAMNQRGDATLSYPIEVPPGRNGLQPQLALQYDSSAGNGWLGVGWSLPTGEVTVDTRWGAPRYSTNFESEDYLLDGQQLVPVGHAQAHRDPRQERVPDQEFRARVEGQFRKIIRHGASPAEYWWEVTDKQGVRSFFGAPDEDVDSSKEDAPVLKTASGNVFRWALHKVVDPHDNSMRYAYRNVESAGVAGSTLLGRDLYLERIDYTRSPGSSGASGAAGPYSVRFLRGGLTQLDSCGAPPGLCRPDASIDRPDPIIDGRGGLKRVTAELLRRIEVSYSGTGLVRAYDLNYVEGAFHKSLLQSITQKGALNVDFPGNVHQFSYIDEIRADKNDTQSAFKGFAASNSWSLPNDDIPIDTGIPLTGEVVDFFGSQEPTAIGGGQNRTFGGHLYLGFNPTEPLKQGSFGFKVGFNDTKSQGRLALVDMDGDGLPDKVVKNDSGFFFHPNQSGPFGTSSFAAAERSMTGLGGVSHLFEEHAFTFSAGLEAYPLGVLSVMDNTATTFNQSNTYTADVNGDGLIDLVKDGEVYFNTTQSGNTVFVKGDSSQTPFQIALGTVVSDNLLPDSELQQIQADNDTKHPRVDTLRRWIAPYTGTIKITGGVKLSRANQSTDGVRVAIQKEDEELWSDTIAASDASTHDPAGVDSISVTAMQRIYFRVQPGADGRADEVQWDPAIVYQPHPDNPPAIDVNDLDVYSYKASSDFTLAGRPHISVTMPFDGEVRLTGTLKKTARTTDDARLVVLFDGQTKVDETLDRTVTNGKITLNKLISVTHGKRLEIHVVIDSPIDLHALTWDPAPEVLYTNATDVNGNDILDQSGNPQIRMRAPYHMDVYSQPFQSAPFLGYPVTGSGDFTAHPVIAGSVLAQGPVVFTVKLRRNGSVSLVNKQRLTLNGTSAVTGNDFTVHLEDGDLVYLDFSSTDPASPSFITTYRIEGDQTLNGVWNAPTAPNIFHEAYRGWAVAGYNGNADRAAQPINQDDLVFNSGGFDKDTDVETDPEKALGQAGKFQKAQNAYAFFPAPGGQICPPSLEECTLPQEDTWVGPTQFIYATASRQSPARLGPDSIAVPQSQQFGGVPAVPRLSRVSQNAVGLGVGFGSLGVDGSFSNGTSTSELDYIDMNGDGFPDVVSHESGIQYTSQLGTLLGAGDFTAAPVPPDDMSAGVRASTTKAVGYGVAGNAAFSVGNSRSGTAATARWLARAGRTQEQMVSLGISLDKNTGSSEEQVDFMDVNGDGLPDRVSASPGGEGLFVSLNLGYGFAGYEFWGEAAINNANNTTSNSGKSISYNDGVYGFAGGVNGQRSKSHFEPTTNAGSALGIDTKAQSLTDINGDGLADLLLPKDGKLYVGVNTGSHFAPLVEWQGGSPTFSEGDSTTVGAGLYFTIAIPLCELACWLIINPGADTSLGSDRQTRLLQDIDGDGYVDQLVSSFQTGNADADLSAAINQTGRTNLLTHVDRPLHGTIDISYKRDGNTFDQPHSRWVMSRVVTFDGLKDSTDTDTGADYQLTTYHYNDPQTGKSSGHYDRFEREFYGYSRIAQTAHNTIGVVPDESYSAPYRTTTRTFRNDTFFTKGLPVDETVEAGASGSGAPFSKATNAYTLRNVDTHEEFDIAQALPDALIRGTSSVFPELVATTRARFEGDPNVAITTATTQHYDLFGNVDIYTDSGDPDTAADDYSAVIGYAACTGSHIVGVGKSIVVTDSNGVTLRQRDSDIDCTNGDLTQLRQQTGGDVIATSDFTYFANGNIDTVTGPENLKHQRYQVEFGYDAETESHITDTTDKSFHYVSSATYDLRFGETESTTDVNGNTVTRKYDDQGRLKRVIGPYEQNTANDTLFFDYHPEGAAPAYAVTQHVDTFSSATGTVDTITFIDGLKRVVQVKKDASIHQDSGPPIESMIVSGRIVFDHVGRSIAASYPKSEAKALNLSWDPVGDGSAKPTRTQYDVIDRVTKVTIPDDTFTTHQYFISSATGFPRLATKTTDAVAQTVGNFKVAYRDVRDQIRTLEEHNPQKSETLFTRYSYDPLQQLTVVTDAKSNVTSVSYDLVGRRTAISNPDAGLTEFSYDPASNLIRKVTANLRATGKAITYDYEFNRLATITYPDHHENNVTYTYGAAALRGQGGNRVGRLTRVQDGSGSEDRLYGLLGEIVQETKTIASDTLDKNGVGQAPEAWTTKYLYDTWGRLQQMTYPDGEVLTYSYDSGGLPRAVTGVKSNLSYPYVTKLEYDRFEQRVFMEDGNGIRSKFTYRADNRRLSNLAAGSFQNLNYGYDAVGNVTALSNNVDIPPSSTIGGPTSQSFGYDGMYRLTSANGQWTQPGSKNIGDKSQRYTLKMDYDSLHNITSKVQTDDQFTGSSKPNPIAPLTYNFGYQYQSSRPHAPTRVGDRTFTYDANGNQTGWDQDKSNQRRRIGWDEENRIFDVNDNGNESTYKYNDSGERVIKRTSQGETAYINQFWTVRNRSDGTKHVFIGATRVVSKLGTGNANTSTTTTTASTTSMAASAPAQKEGADAGVTSNGNGKGGPATGTTAAASTNALQGPSLIPTLPSGVFLYFYHPDHLGSTGYVTDNLGQTFQHVEYFPFGETWAEEDSNKQRTPYLFTGKELDEETKLYYFGARYYDPRTSVWQSTDPSLEDRVIRTSASRDVGATPEARLRQTEQDPLTLAVYSYTRQNPLRFFDPVGAEEEEPLEARIARVELQAGIEAGIPERVQEYENQLLNERVEPTPTPSYKFDNQTEKMLGQLHPVIEEKAREHLALLKIFHINARIRSVFRTYAEQDRLFAKGRTAGGKIVTLVRGGESYHNFRLAYDVTLIGGSLQSYQFAGRVGEALSMEAGVFWTKLPDPGHFQYRGDVTIQQIRSRFESGQDVLAP